ncbi:hypothetical protein ACQKWADRAFT_322779 [Trichoderma austrokoningii]
MDATSDTKSDAITYSRPVDYCAPSYLDFCWDERFARENRDCFEPCENDMAEAKQRKLCKAVMTLVFYIVGMEPNHHGICFKACVEMAMSTKLLFTTAWSRWSGYSTLKAKIKFAQQLTNSTKELHCPSVPFIIAAMALKLVRRVEGTEGDEITVLMKQYKIFDLAPTAIYNYVDNEERPLRVSLREVSLDVDFGYSIRSIVAADNTIEKKETFAVEVTREMTRDQAQNELKDILDLLSRKQDTSVTEEMRKRITLAHMKVLSPADKLSIVKCAKVAKDDRVLGLFDASLDDLDKYTWTEVVDKPIPATCKKSDTERILQSLNKLRETLVREAFEKQPPSTQTQDPAAAELLRDDIAVIKENLESVQRQNGSLKRQNDEVIQMLKDGKRHKP